MKALRLLSLFMVLVILSCSLISCKQEEVDANIPDTPMYEATVSFQIKDGTGKVIGNFEVENYEYKWIKEPTILNIVTHYLMGERGASILVDENGTITRIGGVKIKKGEYVAVMKGINVDVKDILSDKAAQNKNFIDKKMSTYNVIDEDCKEFTLVIAKIQ